ncbi:MAG: trimethylamine methyltransferase family protein [Anaerolineaceae bacterium]|nr:trimethylamine methyltransferase family protein [Anaerolineaceae bacterium]
MRPKLAFPLQFLTGTQVEELHQAILTVLWEIGVRVEWRPALELYAAAGCRVDFENQLVQIPAKVLEQALKTAPSCFSLYGTNPADEIQVTLQDTYTIAGSSALKVLDLEGQHRPATLQDLVDFTHLIDALENADIMHAMVIPQDIPQAGFDRLLLSTILKNTSKHYYSQGLGAASVKDQVEIAAIVQGSTQAVIKQPCFSMVVCLVSPLVHTADCAQQIMECARFGIPLWLEAANMMGATAPITVAGALVEHSANVLAALVLAQLVRPGLPCIFSVASGGFNMRSMSYVSASPEMVQLHCATAQMAHFFGLPFHGGSGLDSCLPDAQAGYERTLQALPMTLAGVNFSHLAFGMMNQLLTSSFEQAIIDNEIFNAIFRLAEGIEITPETIALDQLRLAGPGGQFMNQDYTLYNYRRQQWQPELTNRLEWEQWQRISAGKDMRQRANQRARKLLAEPCPRKLSQEQESEIDKMVRSFQAQAAQNQDS